jgi:hypothetical protein
VVHTQIVIGDETMLSLNGVTPGIYSVRLGGNSQHTRLVVK